jgi:hypothetical protein
MGRNVGTRKYLRFIGLLAWFFDGYILNSIFGLVIWVYYGFSQKKINGIILVNVIYYFSSDM